ncbi:MAG: glycosyltransferase family 2 protein [Leptolyngbyaceae cyanobacterium SL_1_1]|nr:glycosyltransferase family 2 protein [Leptolyngbyaceae cyanobacterium SL_1_1]
MTLEITPPSLPLPPLTATVLHEALTDWKVTGMAELHLAAQSQNPLQLAIALEAADLAIRWQSSPVHPDSPDLSDYPAQRPPVSTYVWPEAPTVLALIPHWRCEPWLRRCLASLHQQSHSLTHTVVIDDASTPPPLEIVKKFANVTLLSASERVGPYRLIQSVIAATDYDAYLFQDADDWSSCDRLKTLLQTAKLSGAELVGSQELRVVEPSLQLQAVGYPLDVNRALAQAPGHALLHPASLVTRSLVQRLGGFATGLRFGGDTEFVLRAYWAARIVNSPRYCYFRRKRPDSLTTAADTGLSSPARQVLTQVLKQQAIARQQASSALSLPNLRPLSLAPAIALTHCWGPSLRGMGG